MHFRPASAISVSVAVATLMSCASMSTAIAASKTETPSAEACPANVRWCFPLDHVLAGGRDVAADKKWWAAQLNWANRVFRPAEVGFTTGRKMSLPARFHEVSDALGRDRIGRKWVRRGRILVLSPLILRDVPRREIERHGVHWRDRSDKRGEDRRRRWLIVVNGADRPDWDLPFVLAHELGHFFGLPHSTYPDSLMNKSPKDRPPMQTWRFVPAEIAIVGRRAQQMVRNRRLRPIPAIAGRASRDR